MFTHHGELWGSSVNSQEGLVESVLVLDLFEHVLGACVGSLCWEYPGEQSSALDWMLSRCKSNSMINYLNKSYL